MELLHIFNKLPELNLIIADFNFSPETISWLLTFEKFFWCGFAALGFAILFNVPVRTLFLIAVLGAIGGLTKFVLLHFGFSAILAPLCGATVIGI